MERGLRHVIHTLDPRQKVMFKSCGKAEVKERERERGDTVKDRDRE